MCGRLGGCQLSYSIREEGTPGKVVGLILEWLPAECELPFLECALPALLVVLILRLQDAWGGQLTGSEKHRC